MNSVKTLSADEKLDWLQLIRSENVGPVTFHHLIEKYGTADRALDRIPELAEKGGAKRKIRIHSRKETKAEAEALINLGGELITSIEPDYPPRLRQIYDPPPVISILGHKGLLQKHSIGIVGSRNASAVARKLTETLSRDLGHANLVITSGLARGIDSAAHLAALETGTLAVVGGGVDIVYPKENQELYEQIRDRGCIIAEQPLGTQPQARHFPRRNRIISGVSLGILVMEAAPKSGSLITARMALEQGREVFAIPGSPMDPRARGTNNLIRNGALLVESAEEILQEISHTLKSPVREPDSDLLPLFSTLRQEVEISDKARDSISILLSHTPINTDDLIRQSELPPSTVLTILLELELAGRLERHFGNRVSLID
ncbi:DNA-processing protein DprA [Sneathiella limimaris]|uniref:DNA-processing protein DprA n=1 Tax=Sneathiella limimaris TaxID=1964213 RepID=UPI001469DE39|nr:DNA-processing protein DprA [Sneathiella limimaris]